MRAAGSATAATACHANPYEIRSNASSTSVLVLSATEPDGASKTFGTLGRGDRVRLVVNYTYRPLVSWVIGRATIPLKRETEFMVE